MTTMVKKSSEAGADAETRTDRHRGTKARRHEVRDKAVRHRVSLRPPLIPLPSLRAFVPSCLRASDFTRTDRHRGTKARRHEVRDKAVRHRVSLRPPLIPLPSLRAFVP